MLWCCYSVLSRQFTHSQHPAVMRVEGLPCVKDEVISDGEGAENN